MNPRISLCNVRTLKHYILLEFDLNKRTSYLKKYVCYISDHIIQSNITGALTPNKGKSS